MNSSTYKTCSNGHIYNSSEYSTCPYCDENFTVTFSSDPVPAAPAPLYGPPVIPREKPDSGVCKAIVIAIASDCERTFIPLTRGFTELTDPETLNDIRFFAKIAFDQSTDRYLLIPSEKKVPYLQGRPVYMPSPLSHGDIIEHGTCRLMFIDLGDASFTV